MYNCIECGGILSTVTEYDMRLCKYCAEKLGLFQLECASCGERISSDEYDEGNGICYDCIINDKEDGI